MIGLINSFININILLLQVEKELRDICSDILNVLDKHLIPAASTGESKVFYYKMKVSVSVIFCFFIGTL